MSHPPPLSITGANLTKITLKIMPINVSIDWLSFNCKSPNPYLTTIDPRIEIKLQNYGTPIFKQVYLIYSLGEELATICTQPYSGIMKSDFVQCKLANKVLYTNDVIGVIQILCNALNLEFNGYSRIDLCFDFNPIQFKFDVHKFIHGQLTKSIIKKQRAQCMLGFNVSNNNSYHFIRYGNKQSDVNFYMYNKTKEMNDKKLKPWIIDKWKANDIDTSTDVWRLEFSIKNTLYQLTDFDTGEFISLKSIECCNPDNITKLFSVLYSKYFDFRRNNGTSRVDRMPKVELIKDLICSYELTPLTGEKESNRTQKLTIKQLLKEFHYLRTCKGIVKDELKVSAYSYAKSFQLSEYASRMDAELSLQ